MSQLFENMRNQVQGKNLSIVFPEGDDERILAACVRLASEGIIKPILIAKHAELPEETAGLVEEGKISVRHPEGDEQYESLVQALVERRKGKTSEEDARKWLMDPNYFGTMLVYQGEADGLVSGAAHSTADTVRPALQIIKTKQGIKKTSGAFIMVKGDTQLVFADCAINIAPTSEDLAETALASVETARAFGMEPRVAMLSFSTKGSAKAPEANKVIEATAMAKEKLPNVVLDGEIQFDAAFVPEVAYKKAPESPLKGQANVFVFPSLEAGNIGYKMVQRLGGFEAVGPILQGLNKPVNDLSRGCSAEDVYNLSLITAAQSLIK